MVLSSNFKIFLEIAYLSFYLFIYLFYYYFLIETNKKDVDLRFKDEKKAVSLTPMPC